MTDYNIAQITAGDLTPADLRTLIEFWQRSHPPLVADGLAGPKTRSSLRGALLFTPGDSVWPLPVLTDGRRPVITSGHAHSNPERPNHFGVDLLYAYRPTDPPMHVGDGGRTEKWWVPAGIKARATAGGRVALAGLVTTGHRIWLDHGDDVYTGYFHLTDMLVSPGMLVGKGAPLGTVGHAPNGDDPVHLHFELYKGSLSDYPRGTVDPDASLATSDWVTTTGGV